MYAQSGNCAGARSPQVAKATVTQIAAILGFMLNLSLHRGSLSKNAEGGQAQFSSKKFRKKLYVSQNRQRVTAWLDR
jgi:capsular polysaccharide biosynthesis protein